MKIENDFRHEACPLCAAVNVMQIGVVKYHDEVVFSTQRIQLDRLAELWQCRSCNSEFIQNAISEKVAADLYACSDAGERWSREPFDRNKEGRLLASLSHFLQPGAHVLDIGCNTGEFLDYARERGCITYGMEYSAASKKIIENKGHLLVDTLESRQREFDVVALFDVVEHLYQPRRMLESIKRVLKPGGSVLIFTGDIASRSAKFCKSGWWYFKYPEHVLFPSQQALANCCGLSLVASVETYASIGYRRNCFAAFCVAAMRYLRGKYDGLPSVGPDHVLLVLKDV